jgi:HK97 gp10 family phage protein
MPVRYKLETKGFSEYLELLAQAGQDIDPVADEMLAAGGDVILAGMEERVPRDTGELASNLECSEPEREGNFHSVTVGVSRDAPGDVQRYGGAQEYGWSDHAGQPYIRPAIDEEMKSARAAMRAVLEKFLGGRVK